MRIIALLALASLAACSGKGASDGNTAAASPDNAQGGVQSAFNQGFTKGFKEKFVAQCVGQAQASSPIKVDFTPICGCSADKLLASKSPADLMKGVSPTDAQAVVAACAKEHPITPPTKS